jgi:hypothetical protein
MAVDWFTGLVGYDGSQLRMNSLMELTPEGEVRWHRDKWLQVEGSWTGNILIGRGAPTSGMLRAAEAYGLLCARTPLWVSGNPTKWLQGHNAFGPSVTQLAPTIHSLVRALPDGVRPPDADDPNDRRGRVFHRSRVDIAVSIDLETDSLVHEWLTAAARSTRSRRGPAQQSGSTVYWGKSSRHWVMKAYCKFCELAVNRPAHSFEELREWSRGHLRLELTLRTPELKERGTLDEEVVFEFWEKVVVGVSDHELVSLAQRISSFEMSSGAKACLNAWLHGGDLRETIAARTWYRYRRLILEQVGLDISLPPARESANIRRAGFDVAELKAKWVRDVPTALQPLLFRPQLRQEKKWPAHP